MANARPTRSGTIASNIVERNLRQGGPSGGARTGHAATTDSANDQEGNEQGDEFITINPHDAVMSVPAANTEHKRGKREHLSDSELIAHRDR
jgi:hypothetical protein